MKILVAGGGISGLAFSVLLKKTLPEVKILLIEKAHAWKNIRYILSLWPNGRNILKEFNLYDWTGEHGREIPAYTIIDKQGHLIKRISFSKISQQFGPIFAIERAKLHQKLRETAIHIPTKLDTTITRLIQNKDNVQVTLTDGTTDSFDLVVGADGVHSQIREEILGRRPVDYYNWALWMAMVKPIPKFSGDLIQMFAPGKVFGIGPSPTNHPCVLFFLPTRHGTPESPEDRIKLLKEKFKDFDWIVPQVLQSLNKPLLMYHDDLRKIHLHEWFKNRVVIIGDAEHALSPLLGMGTSLALEDAYVLSKILLEVVNKSINIQEGLTKFARLRQPHVDLIYNHDRKLWNLIRIETSFVYKLANKCMPLLPDFIFTDPFTKLLQTQSIFEMY